MPRTPVRHKVGHIGVDAGVCWIGDPCYVLYKKPEEMPASMGKSYEEFCDKLPDTCCGPKSCKSFDYTMGHEGLGVVVPTGWGDGSYPVYVEFNKEGRVARVTVEFLSDEED